MQIQDICCCLHNVNISAGVWKEEGLRSSSYVLPTSGIVDENVDSFALRGLFSTLTNVNFSHSAFYDYVNQSQELADHLRSRVLEASGKPDWYELANFKAMLCMQALTTAS